MAVRFRVATGTHLGTVRMNNEDSALATDRLLVLADGMGGHAAGEVASVVALRVFTDIDHDPGDDLGENLIVAGRRAREALMAMSAADPGLESLGTTLVVVVSDGEKVLVGHIGDSRVYVLREGSMYQVTTDHTHVQRMVELGQLSPDQVRSHPYRAMILKSLDDHPEGPDLDVINVTLRDGDRVLLCSDGLSDYLSADEIGQALAVQSREQAADALVTAALQAATRDNVTVVVADVDTGDDDGEPVRPIFTGAVTEPIRLSARAEQALERALPGVRLDPREPWRHSRMDGEARDGAADDGEAGDGTTRTGAAGDGAASEGPADDGATDRPSGETDTGEPDAEPTVTVPASERPAAPHSRTRAAAGAGPRAAGTASEPASALPGILAAAFTVAVLFLLAFFLFG